MTCYLCGATIEPSDPPSVLTVTVQPTLTTPDERIVAAISYAFEIGFLRPAPVSQTYLMHRACIQPVLHARVPDAQTLREAFKR